MNNKGFKRVSCAVLAALACLSTVSAQTSIEEQKEEINNIKKNKSYISAEATLPDKQSAVDLARDILYQKINEWVASQKKFVGSEKVVTVNTNYATEDMMLPRGNMFRAFMYVKKSDIIPVTNVTVNDTPEMKVADKNGVTPAAIEPIFDPKVEAVTKELLDAGNTGRLSAVLGRLKQERKIAEYNKLSALSAPEQFFMVIFTREGNIEAVLSDGAERVNMRTGKADAIGNYKGCGAIGVKINK